MSAWWQSFLLLDFFPLLAGIFAALSCGLLGNFLVLRRQSLMGDAISHAVLPGLVGAFLLAQSRNAWVMFAGATLSALLTVALTEIIKRLGRVEPGAAMGVVFSVLFALGVYMLESGALRGIDLDADCVLHGNLQNLFWRSPESWADLFSARSLGEIPTQIWTLLGTTLAVIAFIGLFFKELRIASFDPGISTVQGIHAGAMNMVLMGFVAVAAVASFEAVGSILVIAMLICPAATARLLTDRLGSQILASAAIALLSAVLGYWSASVLNVNAAGMMSVMGGALLVVSIFVSPSHGIIAKRVHQKRLSQTIALEDVLGTLYRVRETDDWIATEALLAHLGHRPRSVRALRRALEDGLAVENDHRLTLSEKGEAQAADIIRRHRLWEGYLVDRVGLSPDHVHDTAERLEHLDLSARLREAVDRETDPQGKPIPREQ